MEAVVEGQPMNHVIDISDRGGRLCVRDGLLCLDLTDSPQVTVPLAEVAALVLASRQVTLTQPVLSGLALAGAVVIACDERFTPVSMTLPLTGYHAPARRMLAQARASRPLQKRAWQQVVKAKVEAQARVLEDVRGEDWGLRELARQVRSGDSGNIEGQAARVYWLALWGDDFLRRTDGNGQNRYLNYGYAVLRAIVARAICAAGLHPGIGIHHHHRANAYCLADDLMEPLRPVVDRKVLQVAEFCGPDAPMEKSLKGRLLEIASDLYEVEGEKRSLFDAAWLIASSVGQLFEGQRRELVLPEL